MEPGEPIRTALGHQSDEVQMTFTDRVNEIRRQLRLHGIESTLYWRNSDMVSKVPIVPISALNGVGELPNGRE